MSTTVNLAAERAIREHARLQAFAVTTYPRLISRSGSSIEPLLAIADDMQLFLELA